MASHLDLMSQHKYPQEGDREGKKGMGNDSAGITALSLKSLKMLFTIYLVCIPKSTHFIHFGSGRNWEDCFFHIADLF